MDISGVDVCVGNRRDCLRAAVSLVKPIPVTGKGCRQTCAARLATLLGPGSAQTQDVQIHLLTALRLMPPLMNPAMIPVRMACGIGNMKSVIGCSDGLGRQLLEHASCILRTQIVEEKL